MRVAAAVCALFVAIATGCGSGAYSGTLAEPGTFLVLNAEFLCFEPDVVNVSGQQKTFAVQLELGNPDGSIEYSEIHEATLANGEPVHLHILDAYWEPGSDAPGLEVQAAEYGCSVVVYDITN